MPPPPPRRPQAKKLKKGPLYQEASEAQRLARSRGALLGLCVGEALGVTYDGRNLPAEQFPALCTGPLEYPRGGGRFELRAGQTSWGTQTAVATATVLKNLRRYDLEEAGREYKRWLPCAFDVPETTKAAVELLLEGRHPEHTGRRVWLAAQQRGAESAPLVRAVPIAVFYARHRDERVKATLEDCAITHFSPLCQLAGATLGGLIAAAITTPKERIEVPDLLKAAETEVGLAASTLGRTQADWVQQVKDASDWLREDLQAAQEDDPLLYGPELHLFQQPTSVRVAFRLALWELLHAPSLKAGLIDVANRGGGSAVNAALTGALLGAVHGDTAFPDDWREPVLGHVPVQGPGPLSNVYHPNFLMTLAGLAPEDRQ